MERGPPRPTKERDGIVIGRQDYGESDRIVRVLTPDEGRVSVLARGARADRSRWAGLDLATRARIRSRPGRTDLETLVEIEVADPRVGIRGSLERLALAAYACELCGALAREGHPEPRLYGLLEMALLVLDAATEDPGDALRAGLEAKALTFVGVAPVLDRCVVCGGAPEAEMAFASGVGGLTHLRCAPSEGSIRYVTREYAAALEAARRAPLRDLLDVRLPPGPADVLHEAVAAHLGRALSSRAVLDALLH
ncbi:MAG: DNA repair protein RecO [Pseudomonadota bacterium]|nr:DNA repair protein RecO [Pseudomonadota bacterium]